MSESFSKLREVAKDSEVNYDRESTREEAAAHLDESLSRIELPENMPSKLDGLYKREHFLASLDNPNFDNSDRHMVRIAEEEIAEMRQELSISLLNEYKEKYAPRGESPQGEKVDYSQT